MPERGYGICDYRMHVPFSMQTFVDMRRHFGGLSTSRRFAMVHGIIRAANESDDLQRGIQLAFAVPETHVASAIGYLVGDGPTDEQFSDEIPAMFETLATPRGWALCADLLKIRLELRANKLRQTRDVEGFYQSLVRGPR
jgi:hypothetical protein